MNENNYCILSVNRTQNADAYVGGIVEALVKREADIQSLPTGTSVVSGVKWLPGSCAIVETNGKIFLLTQNHTWVN